LKKIKIKRTNAQLKIQSNIRGFIYVY